MSSNPLGNRISRFPEEQQVTDVDIYDNTQQQDNKELERRRYASDTGAREKLAFWTAIIVTIWLYLVMCILMSNTDKFKLSDKVLMTLLGTTTLNVLGLSFIVLKGHFQSSSEKPKAKTTKKKKAASQ